MAYCCSSVSSYSNRSISDRHGIAWENIFNKRLDQFHLFQNLLNIDKFIEFLNFMKNLID